MKKIMMGAGLVLAAMQVMSAQAEDISDLPSGRYVLDKAHSSVHWNVDHMGLSTYTARFTDFDATLDLNEKNITGSKVKAHVSVLSMDTGYPYADQNDFDKELAEHENWFNGNVFPKAEFVSTELMQKGDGKGVMKGNLTMLGITKPVEFDVVLNGVMESHLFTGNPALGLTAKAVVTRSEWGLDAGLGLVGDEVEIVIQAEFMQEDE